MPFSLRLRLVVLPALVVIVGLFALAMFEARDAGERVRIETTSAVELGRTLAQSAVARAERALTLEQGLADLERDLPNSVRHIRLSLSRDVSAASAPPARRSNAPDWFERWVDAPGVSEQFKVHYAGEHVATVTLVSRPGDEIEEVWQDWRHEMGLLTAVSLGIMVVVILAVGLALRPLSALSSALNRMEEGDFTVRIPSSADPSQKRLAARFNSLAASLEQATADNRRLMEKLMSVQEAERKEIAHELHDEFGPSLFAIRADLGAISRWVRKKEPKFAEIQERLLSISGLVAQIQKINSRLLERLRPLVLDQMGLTEALQRLIADWRERYRNLTFKSQIDPVADLDEAAVHALYRAAQECLTNTARHAGARHVLVRLSQDRDKVTLVVEDDGRGFQAGTPYGFGLLGMAERQRAAGGGLEIRPREGGGTIVEAWVKGKAGKR